MTPERWRQVTDVFHAARARETATREQFLDVACAGDGDLRAEVVSLLEAHGDAGAFGELPISPIATTRADRAFANAPAATRSPEPAVLPVEGHSRWHPFLLLVWFAAVTTSVLFGYAGWLLVQSGGAVTSFGWEQARKGNAWYVASVDPQGPAAGRLNPGDRLVRMNGVPPFGGGGTALPRRRLSIGDTYPIAIDRDGERQEHTLVVASGERRLAERLTYFLVSLVWCVVGLFIGFAQAGRPDARLAFGAAVVTGWVFLQGNLESGNVFHPLHVVLGFHFFCRFPTGRPVAGVSKWVLVLTYGMAALPVAIQAWLRITELTQGPAAVSSLVTDHGAIVAIRQLRLPLFVFYITIAGMVVVAFRNYRELRSEDQRRRVRWVAHGSIIALAPQIVWSVADLIAGGERTSFMALPSNVSAAGVPVVVAYAVVRHRVFDIRVVVRRGVQYLLAKSALQALVAVPLLALTYTVIVQRDRTVAELVTESTGYVYWIAIAGLSLWFRQPIRLWLDRRFFREEHDREQVLLGLVGDLGKVQSIAQLSELVSAKLESALHPSSVYLWYRDPGELAAASSSNPLLTPADFPAGGRWLSWLEERGAAAEVPLPEDAGLVRDESIWFADRGVSLVLPIADSDDRLAGVLMLGPKQSEEPYSPSDRELLQAIATQTGVVRENLRLRAQVSEDQRIRQDVLTRLDRQHVQLLKECPRCGTCFDAPAERCDRDGQPLTLSLPVSRTIEGKYRLDRVIGRGGMGVVYEARDLRLERDVAIKILLGRSFGAQAAVRRFRREARAVARLNHPRIVSVYNYGGLEGEGAYIVMERISGITLRAELDRVGAMPPVSAVEWFDQILDGLSAAHALGIVHRDLKPENVIGRLDDERQLSVKVLDFGLAKVGDGDALTSGSMTAEGVVMGTIGYMGPEQLVGGAIDQRTDIFAVGIMLAEVLTGRRPFQGETYGDVTRAVLHDTYHLPTSPMETRAVDDLLQRCLAKDPRDRFPSAVALRQALIPLLRAAPPFSVA